MHEDRLTYWLKQAERGTRGEMVSAILADWREERHQRRAGGLVSARTRRAATSAASSPPRSMSGAASWSAKSMRQRTEGADVNTLTWIVVGIGMLVFGAVQVWVSVVVRQIQREAEASRAECRRVEAHIAALAAEVLGRPRP